MAQADSQDTSADTSEAAQADAQEQGTPDTETAPPAAAPLNREQRRAQSRGKAAPGGAGTANRQGAVNSGVGNRASGSPGQVRFPRTGHK